MNTDGHLGALVTDQTPIPPLTAAKARKATLIVCERAHDAEDAAMLLDALGLTS